MKRREIIKMAALATGVAVSAPLLSSLLSGCQTDLPDADADYQLEFFNREEFSLVRDLVDIILPKTDSPAASKVGVHRMIDHMVGKVYNAEDKAAYRKNFTELVTHLKEGKELKSFLDLEGGKKLAMLQHVLDAQEERMMMTKKSFQDLRQQTVAYYLSTEEISKKYLTYLPVPGKYEPCITVAEAGGKAWAL